MTEPAAGTLGLRIFQVLLRAYPGEFRRTFGRKQ